MIQDIVRTYKKLILLVLLVLSGLVFWFYTYRDSERNTMVDTSKWERQETDEGVFYNFETEYISGTLTYGTQGITKEGEILPVTVTTQCKKKTFDGLLQIYLPGEYGKGVAYQSAISCKKGVSSRQLMEIPQLGNSSGFIFRITDQFGNILFSESVLLDKTEEETITIGVLSDQYSDYSYFDTLQVKQDDKNYLVQTMKLSSSFAGDERQLRAISVLLIDNFDTSGLSQLQVEAINTWVENGGILLFGGGAESEENIAAFGSTYGLSVSAVNQGKIQMTVDENDLGELLVSYAKYQFENEKSWNRVSWISSEAIYEREVENGRIAVLSFSFADNALIQWRSRDEAVGKILEEMTSDQIEEQGRADQAKWYLQKAMYAFEDSGSPNIFYYGLFFIIYLFCMGFLIYDILKEIKRKEYIWYIVPILSIVFTALVGVRAISNSVDNDQFLAGVQIQDMETEENEVYLYYQSKDGKKVSMSLNSIYESVEPMDYVYAQTVSNQQTALVDYVVNQTKKGEEIEISDSVPGVSQVMKISADTIDRTNISAGNFKVKISGDDKKFRGTIENTSDTTYRRVLLIRGTQYAILSNVERNSESKIKGSDVSVWQSSTMDENMELENQTGVVSNLLTYLEQTYIREDNKLNQLIVIGITDEKSANVFRDEHAFDRYLSVEVNRYKILSQTGQN